MSIFRRRFLKTTTVATDFTVAFNTILDKLRMFISLKIQIILLPCWNSASSDYYAFRHLSAPDTPQAGKAPIPPDYQEKEEVEEFNPQGD